MQISVTVIIPIYNASILLERSIDSVIANGKGFNLEIIAVDDGSTDNSVEILREKYPNVKILQQANQGPAAARNRGIETATGTYLAFLDADDYWEPHFLLKTVEFLESNREAIAVSVGQIHKFPGKEDQIIPQFLKNNNQSNRSKLLKDFYIFWAKHNHVCTGSVLMRTEIVKETEGQRAELRITEDLEFWAYLATFGPWGFIPKILFVSDGGAVTKKIGWYKKNKMRWASAPSLEEWESRIIKKLHHPLPEGYKIKQGQIAKNLAYSMLLSGRKKRARSTIVKNEKFLPTDKMSKLLVIASKTKLTWIVVKYLLFVREKTRRI